MTSFAPAFNLDKQFQRDHQFYFDQQGLPFDYAQEPFLDCPALANLPLQNFEISALLSSDTPKHLQQDDSMHVDPWGPVGHFSSKFGRFPHQRESSFSSLASSGPVSPFQQHVSNPQISINDASGDAMMDMHSNEMGMSHGAGTSFYHQFAKPLESYQPYQNLDSAAVTEMAYPVTIPGPAPKQRPRVDRSLLPAPEFVSGSSRSHPASVASSIAGDSPATPTVGEVDPMERRRQGHNAPKLDRTMTDVYGDELYSPNFTITSSSPSQQANVATLPNNDLFNQRLSAANSQHLNTAHRSSSSNLSRDISPFCNASPLTPAAAQDWIIKGNVSINSAQRMREQNKARQDARVVQEQQQQRKIESRTPQTISPKDAMLEFNDAEEEAAPFPLFPQETPEFSLDQLTGVIPAVNHFANGAHMNYNHTQLPTTIQVPHQYPFVAQTRAIHEPSVQRSSSGESNVSQASNQALPHGRPGNMGTDGGTYTCTYHGYAGMPSSLLNSQAGPHQCNRINPSTGKPCNTIFSRPYDLTRHEDTIHNARKQKVHCNLCTEDKTFSRADALTRHYRVCHPDVELPGKHRRRGGS
ncbi:Transcriptional regulator RPN4 [Escovopsis weberi]|uniref:Transcriptional regulator RPN4 n=1 Tax=Escovopsis weberi TaxID=150374 RepID=A0A0M9VTJ5_ESCWE|nr:Transcriptional regulator RPN4 [Escovopsis weberi]